MLPQQQSLKKKPLLTVFGFLLLIYYSFQNFIPGIDSLSRPVSYGIVGLVFLLVVCCFLPELKRDVPVFFRHFKTYCGFFFPKFVFFFLIYFLIALVISVVAGEASANQEALYSVPLPMLAFTALIYAPVLEETIYRGFLRRLIPNDALFVLISALVFGLVHMLHPGQSLAQMLYFIEYALIGGFLADLYVKSGNICLSMLGHFSMNLIAFIPMIFR